MKPIWGKGGLVLNAVFSLGKQIVYSRTRTHKHGALLIHTGGNDSLELLLGKVGGTVLKALVDRTTSISGTVC